MATATRHLGDPIPVLGERPVRPPPPEDFVLTLWTDAPELALAADRAGVQRIGLDFERRGKAERQRGLGTWISPHRVSDLERLRATLSRAALFARTDPLNPASRDEVDQLIGHGVNVLMLPMFETPGEVERFLGLVDGRAAVVPLLETRRAAEQIGSIAAIEGVAEIHIGINDMALSLGARNRFAVLSSPLVVRAARCVRQAGLRLGIGAVGLPGDRRVPIDPDLLYARYVQLGASAALIARSLVRDRSPQQVAEGVMEARRRLGWWRRATEDEREWACSRLVNQVARQTSW